MATPNTDNNISVPDGLLDFFAELNRRGLELRYKNTAQLYADDHGELQRLVELNPGVTESDVMHYALEALNEVLSAEAEAKRNWDGKEPLVPRLRRPLLRGGG